MPGQIAPGQRDHRGADEPIAETRWCADGLDQEDMRQQLHDLGGVDLRPGRRRARAALALPKGMELLEDRRAQFEDRRAQYDHDAA
jgi:hypothetical protein